MAFLSASFGRRTVGPCLFLALTACSGSGSELGGDGAGPEEESEAALCPAQPTDVLIERSLVVRQRQLLENGNRFAFDRVLNQLAATGGAPGLTGRDLYRQMFDSNNDARHARLAGSQHCDDLRDERGQPAVNGYPIQCLRQEGLLAATDPFLAGSIDGYVPIALFNRFDLAPSNGAHCGEYRIVYGKRSGVNGNLTDRNLIIFEAQLPNPSPSCGIRACRPVAQHWASLSAIADPAVRAQRLDDFYFRGLPGFRPAIHAANFAPGTGQIRTNQFTFARDYYGEGVKNQAWQLREYELVATAQGLRARMVSVKGNPWGELFEDDTAWSRGPAFREHFIGQIGNLALVPGVDFFMDTPEQFNAGQSTAQGAENDYRVQLLEGSGGYRARIQNELVRLGSSLTPENVADRATATSCAGCHRLSSGVDLGGGVRFPGSLGFVHVSERVADLVPCLDSPQCWRISPALNGAFLPSRERVLESFLANTSPCDSCASGDGAPHAPEPGLKPEPRMVH